MKTIQEILPKTRFQDHSISPLIKGSIDTWHSQIHVFGKEKCYQAKLLFGRL